MNPTGTGLGLSICKQIVEKMGGHIDVHSKLGVGTTFRVVISTMTKIPKEDTNQEVDKISILKEDQQHSMAFS